MPEATRTPESVYDLIVIGAGPAGETAGVYAARAALRTLVLDKGLTAGALGSASRELPSTGAPEPAPGSDDPSRRFLLPWRSAGVPIDLGCE